MYKNTKGKRSSLKIYDDCFELPYIDDAILTKINSVGNINPIFKEEIYLSSSVEGEWIKMKYLEWQKEAIDKAMEYDFEIIDDVYACNEYVEIRGTMGGDGHTFRYYKNGGVYEK